MANLRTPITLHEVIDPEMFPAGEISPPEGFDKTFQGIYVTEYEGDARILDPYDGFELGLTVPEEVKFELPGLDGVEIVIGGIRNPTLSVGLTGDAEAGTMSLSLVGSIYLRFTRDWLKPVKADGDGWVEHPSKEFTEIEISGEITIDQDLAVTFDAKNEFSIGPAMIADTGFVVEGTVALDFSKTETVDASQDLSLPGGQSVSDKWQGVVFTDTTLHFPEDMNVPVENIGLENFHIGTGGITGTVSLEGDMPASDSGEAKKLFGIPYQITTLDVKFVQTALASSSIKAKMQLPFFDDPVELDLGVTMEGDVTATLSSTDGSLQTVDREYFRLKLERLGFAYEENVPAVNIGGTVEPRNDNIPADATIPSVDVEELRVDADGNVAVEGGWLDLGDQYVAEVGPAELEITKFGIGKTDAGGKWIGFNGGVKITAGVPAGASVEGLRIAWDEPGTDGPSVSLDGVGVEFEVPGTLAFKGEVSWGGKEFRGEIDLELETLDMRVDAELVIGTDPFTYVGVYIEVDPPAGIPLGPTGLGVFGFGGLFAVQMEPDKKPEEKWYSVDHSNSWFHDPKGVTELEKWTGGKGAMGFGTRVSIATLPDAGSSIAMDTTFMIAFPGPIVAIQGRAELVEPGTTVDGEAPYQTVIVIDGRAGTLTAGIDARYQKPESGGPKLLDISGSAEAFFSFSDFDAWYVNIGRKKPKEQRVRAKAVEILTADSYLMIDSSRITMGAWAGYDESYEVGPVSATLASYIDSNAALNLHPAHFHGELNAHSEISAEAFGVRIGRVLDILIEADVLDPFHLLGEFTFQVPTPWPFPDPDVSLTLEWGPIPDPPTLSDPVDETGISHKKLASSWQGAVTTVSDESGQNMAPAKGDDSVDRPVVPLDVQPEVTFEHPVHNQTDIATNDSPPDPEYEVIGDPVKNEGPGEAKYTLKTVELRKWDPTASDSEDNWERVDDITGEWIPMPQQPKQGTEGGQSKTSSGMSQTKLRLQTRTPFVYSRHTGGAWEDAIERWYPDYPCPPEHHCYDFKGLTLEDDFTGRHETVENQSLFTLEQSSNEPEATDAPVFTVVSPGSVDHPPGEVDLSDLSGLNIETVYRPLPSEDGLVVSGYARGGVSTTTAVRPYIMHITLPESRQSVEVRLRTRKHAANGWLRATLADETKFDEIQAAATNDADLSETWEMGIESERRISLTAPGDATLDSVVLGFMYESESDDWSSSGGVAHMPSGPSASGGSLADLAIMEVCNAEVSLATASIPAMERRMEGIRDRLAAWEDTGPVLEPYTTYQLKIETEIEGRGRDGFDWSETKSFTRYLGFKTEGPPGISTPSPLPSSESTNGDGSSDSSENRDRTVLTDLSRYVEQTEPATVPSEGEQPPLPRPVYRTDPVSVDFNEDYVDLLYKLANRDLALYLYDTNNNPVRDLTEKLIVEENQWGTTEELLLDRAEHRWLSVLDSSSCASLAGLALSMTKRLERDAEQRILSPDAVHEARLTPLLLHERFDEGQSEVTDRWTVFGGDDTDASSWDIDGHERSTGNRLNMAGDRTIELVDETQAFVAKLRPHTDTITIRSESGREDEAVDTSRETYSIVDTTPDPGSGDSNPQVTLSSDPTSSLPLREYEIPARHAAHHSDATGDTAWEENGVGLKLTDVRGNVAAPDSWDDIRIAVTLQTLQGKTGDIGVVFRYQNSDNHYRFTMNNRENVSQLDRVTNGTIAQSWESDKSYRSGMDYRISIEAIGDEIRVIIDDETVFAVSDPEGPDSGTLGLYAPENSAAQFENVRVDDFRNEAPVAYSFEFTTSLFANLRHQLHSYQDETWVGRYPTEALPPTSELPPADEQAEYRHYRHAAVEIENAPPADRAQALSFPDQLEIARLDGVDHNGSTSTAEDRTPKGFLIRSPEPIDWDNLDLTISRGPRFETQPTPPERLKLTDATLDTDPSEASVSLLLRESGDISGYAVEYRLATSPGIGPVPSGERFADDFSARTMLDEYDVVDGNLEMWSINDADGLLEAQQIADESTIIRDDSYRARGTVAAEITLADAGMAGLVLRERDSNDEYRFILSSDDTLRFVRIEDGTQTVLRENHTTIHADHSYNLRLSVTGVMIRGYLNGIPVFTHSDPRLQTKAAAGVVTTGGASCASLTWHDKITTPQLFNENFEEPTADDWQIVDEPPRSKRSSEWVFDDTNEELRQRSNLYGFEGPPINAPGTFAVVGDNSWTDYRTTVNLTSDDNDAIGVLFRYRDEDNFYRFSMDAEREYRRLVRKVDGEVELLWEAEVGYEVGREYTLTLDCVDSQLTGYLDGEQLFTVEDDSLTMGAVGLYCRANEGARFHHLKVTAAHDTWIPYHVFDNHQPLIAGTRIGLSKTLSNDMSQQTNVKHFQPNRAPAFGLPSDHVYLRVRKPNDESAHAREFFAENKFSKIYNVSPIRSQDGAGLLLLNDTGLATGQYRLTIEADDPIMDPVTLSIPWKTR